MPRVYSKGLSYFPLSVTYFQDTKVTDLIVDFQDLGEIVFIRTLSMVFAQGYYIEADVDRFSKMLFCTMRFRDNSVTYDQIKRVVLAMAEYGLIDKYMMNRGIITSKGIQKQYYASTSRRKKVEHEYWLLDNDDEDSLDETLKLRKNKVDNVGNGTDEVYQVSTNGTDNGENDDLNEEDDDNFQQKEKEKKKENKKEKKKRIDKNDKFDISLMETETDILFKEIDILYPGPKLNYYTKCLIKDKILSIYDDELVKYNELLEELSSEYDFELFTRCFNYTRRYMKHNMRNIYDPYNFLRQALDSNLHKMEGYDERMEQWFNGGFEEVLNRLCKKDKE